MAKLSIEKLTALFRRREEEQAETFRGVVAQVAAGKVSEEVTLETLVRLGRTPGELAEALERYEERAAWRKLADGLPAAKQRFSSAFRARADEEARHKAEIERLEKEHQAKLRELQREQGAAQIAVDEAERARRSLHDTAVDDGSWDSLRQPIIDAQERCGNLRDAIADNQKLLLDIKKNPQGRGITTSSCETQIARDQRLLADAEAKLAELRRRREEITSEREEVFA